MLLRWPISLLCLLASSTTVVGEDADTGNYKSIPVSPWPEVFEYWLIESVKLRTHTWSPVYLTPRLGQVS